MSVPSFCRAGARAWRNAENTLGSPHTHTAGPWSASHIITWTHVVGSECPNPSSSPVSVLPSNTPQPRGQKKKKENHTHLFFSSKSAYTIKSLSQGRAEVMLFFFSVFSHQRPQCYYHCRVEGFPFLYRSSCWTCLTHTFPVITGFCPWSLASTRHLRTLGIDPASPISVKRQLTSRSSDTSKKNSRSTRSLNT